MRPIVNTTAAPVATIFFSCSSCSLLVIFCSVANLSIVFSIWRVELSMLGGFQLIHDILEKLKIIKRSSLTMVQFLMKPLAYGAIGIPYY